MRIAFLDPSNYHNPTIRFSGPSFGLAYISACLKQAFSQDIEAITLHLSAAEIYQQKPDMIGISAFTHAYSGAIDAAKWLKARMPDVPIIVGGPHISALPQNLQPSMDIGVVGEGEVPMTEIVRLFLKQELVPEQLQKIHGLVYWHNGQLQRAEHPEQRLNALDSLPLPDRQLMQAYWAEKQEHLAWEQTLCTSRGCPFTCNFCMYSKTANLVRYHSVERVLQDIEAILRDYPRQSHIRITDDLFVTKKSRLLELAQRIRSEGYHHRVTLGCMGKASFFDEEFCQILKDMNITSISFGFEHGSDKILHYLKDRKSSVAKNLKTLELCRKYGIHVGGYFIVGAPAETPEDLAKSYWFIRQNKAVMAVYGLAPLQAMPGTAVWQETQARGLVDEHYQDWGRFDFQALEQDHYLFLNQHYSYAWLQNVNRQSLVPLKESVSAHMILLPLYRYLLKIYYEQLVIPQIRRKFKPGSRLLHIHRGDLSLMLALEDDYQVVPMHWAQTEVPEGPFEGVVMSHTLEKWGMKAPQWSPLAALQCPLLLWVENGAAYPRLLALLSGKGWLWDGLEQYESRYFFSGATLRSHVPAGFQLVSQERCRLPQTTEVFQSVEAYLTQATTCLQKETFLHEVYNYPLLMHVLQVPGKEALLEHLKAVLPMAAFLPDADCYSYALELQPLPVSLAVGEAMVASTTGS